MKQYLKCYFAFTTRLYCILCLLLCPAAIIVVNTLIRWISRGNTLYEFSLTMEFLLVEIIGNYLFSGGIASRQTEKLTYLKSSAMGEQVLRNVMAADMIRRFLYLLLEILCVLALSEILFQNNGTVPMNSIRFSVFFGMLFAGYFYGTLGIMIARLFDSFRATFVIWYIAVWPLSINRYILYKEPFSYVMPAVYLVLSILVSILSIRIVIKRLKESCYDKSNKIFD